MPTDPRRGEYELSTDPGRLIVTDIHAYLSRSYWAAHIPIELVRRAIAGSLCVGVYHAGRQVAFARVVTDRATFAYLCDVYVLEDHRDRGLARWMMEAVVTHPDLQGLRRFVLHTRDAHGLYREFGFTESANPRGYMEIARPDPYAAFRVKE
jgi:ribosomal protein S18 acetylase RimI-like enzyme